MTESHLPLTMVAHAWEDYQQRLIAAIAPLSPEHLALPTAPHHLTLGKLLSHMIDARVFWFHVWMGEEFGQWDDDGHSVPEVADLIARFATTWHMIEAALVHWTRADLDELFVPPDGEQDNFPTSTRWWIIWHVLEHEIHHGGELSLALGTYGLKEIYF